jgi:c-di-GMP-related signal transduction protein
LDGSVRALSPALTVVVLEETAADPELTAACRGLREAGYRIAVPLEGWDDPRVGLVGPRDLVRVDLRSASPSTARTVAHVARAADARLLAVGLDTQDAVELAGRLHADAYQGRFFQQPSVVSGRRLSGSRLAHLLLLQAVSRSSIDYDEVEEIIKRDVSLAWKFLNHINSAFFGWEQRIESIRHGVVLLGERGVRRWVALVAVTGLREELPAELVTSAVIRGRFCERLAPLADEDASPLEAFLAGMFSLLDSLLGMPLEEALDHIALPEPVAAAILEGDGLLGTVLDLVRAYERGDWDRVDDLAVQTGVDPSHLLRLYLEAIHWARDARPGESA